MERKKDEQTSLLPTFPKNGLKIRTDWEVGEEPGLVKMGGG